MSAIVLKKLSYSYEGSDKDIFEKVNLTIDTDWKLGLVGRNGKGKTTLLRLLHNELEYSGTITNEDREFLYFPYNFENEDMMIIDLFQEKLPLVEEWVINKEFKLLNLEISTYEYFSNLSEGEKVKVKLIMLFLNDSGFILIDEPTNHLDIYGREIVAKYLDTKKGFIVVSHDRSFLDLVCDHILAITNSKVILERGNYSSWEENKLREDKMKVKKNEKLVKEINVLKKSARQKEDWSNNIEKSKNLTRAYKGDIQQGFKPDKGAIGTKAAKMMKKSMVTRARIDKNIEEKQDLLVDIDEVDSLKMNYEDLKINNLVVINNLTIEYDDRVIFENFSYSINSGDCVAVVGANGSGKSSLIKAIINQTSGVEIPKRVLISYVFQTSENLSGSLDDFIIAGGIDETKFKTLLRKLGFERYLFSELIDSYSSGQKKKLLLAKSLLEKTNLYVWDEPLNYLDIVTREQLENVILEYQPTMIFIEHDKQFIDNIATKIIKF